MMNESKLCWNCQDWMVSSHDLTCGWCGASQPDPRIPLKNKIAELEVNISKVKEQIDKIDVLYGREILYLSILLWVCVIYFFICNNNPDVNINIIEKIFLYFLLFIFSAWISAIFFYLMSFIRYISKLFVVYYKDNKIKSMNKNKDAINMVIREIEKESFIYNKNMKEFPDGCMLSNIKNLNDEIKNFMKIQDDINSIIENIKTSYLSDDEKIKKIENLLLVKKSYDNKIEEAKFEIWYAGCSKIANHAEHIGSTSDYSTHMAVLDLKNRLDKIYLDLLSALENPISHIDKFKHRVKKVRDLLDVIQSRKTEAQIQIQATEILERSVIWRSLLEKRKDIRTHDDCQNHIKSYTNEIDWIEKKYKYLSKSNCVGNRNIQQCIDLITKNKKILTDAYHLTVDLQEALALNVSISSSNSSQIMQELDQKYNELINEQKANEELATPASNNPVIEKARDVLSENQARIEVEQTLTSEKTAAELAADLQKYRTSAQETPEQQVQRNG